MNFEEGVIVKAFWPSMNFTERLSCPSSTENTHCAFMIPADRSSLLQETAVVLSHSFGLSLMDDY